MCMLMHAARPRGLTYTGIAMRHFSDVCPIMTPEYSLQTFSTASIKQSSPLSSPLSLTSFASSCSKTGEAGGEHRSDGGRDAERCSVSDRSGAKLHLCPLRDRDIFAHRVILAGRWCHSCPPCLNMNDGSSLNYKIHRLHG